MEYTKCFEIYSQPLLEVIVFIWVKYGYENYKIRVYLNFMLKETSMTEIIFLGLPFFERDEVEDSYVFDLMIVLLLYNDKIVQFCDVLTETNMYESSFLLCGNVIRNFNK